MYTIGEFVKYFQISRSTLIYYDKINLLKPTGRSEGNYRLYSDADKQKMQQIAVYKEAGLSLTAIAEILGAEQSAVAVVLEQRLHQLNGEISELRQQQQLLINLLNKDSLLRTGKVMTVEQWVALLEAAGMNKQDRQKWHEEFERTMPEAHTDFLQSLGLSEDEVTRIKSRSKS